MTNRIIAIQGNHPSTLNPMSDTTVFLATEAQNIKYKIFYYEPKNLSIIDNNIIAKGFFVKFNYLNKKFYKIIKYKKLNLLKCKFILIRQDPPFNLEYISTTYILDQIKNRVKIVNNPTAIRNVSEKLYSPFFQKYMPKTIFTRDLQEIKKFYKINKKIIIKPIHGHGGNNIHLIQGSFKTKLISNFIKKHGHIMCQKFLYKIKYGDKRIWLINGKICGAISRIPKKDSFLSNLSKGAKAIIAKPTKIERMISNIIAKDLKHKNIYFAGIDFIDEKLNGDINVTSPTGLKTYYDLSKINLAKIFWKGLKV